MQDECERRSGAPRAVKHRLARASLILLAGVVLVGLVVAWIALREPRSAGSAGPIARADSPPVQNDAPGGSRVERDSASSPRASEDLRRFDGHGRIRGVLEARGVDLPIRWTLVLEPDPTLVGSDHAESRRVEFAAGESRFEVAGLPFGGYRLFAEAASTNGARVSVLLTRGANEATVTLRLAPAGFVDGIVFDAAGRPAEGLVVHVENQRSRSRTQGIVDATGLFVVRDVKDGEYEIRCGEFDGPLVPPGTFTFRAPSLRWRETRLPPTGSLLVHVRDHEERAIANSEVVGSAPPKGAFRSRTGPDGNAHARFLLPGRYTVEARRDEGHVGRAVIDVGANERVEITIVVE